jgi:hypothetical protein
MQRYAVTVSCHKEQSRILPYVHLGVIAALYEGVRISHNAGTKLCRPLERPLVNSAAELVH